MEYHFSVYAYERHDGSTIVISLSYDVNWKGKGNNSERFYWQAGPDIYTDVTLFTFLSSFFKLVNLEPVIFM